MAISTSTNRQSRSGIFVLGGFGCLGLLLFTIASVIVISLIPLYLPRRNGGQAQYIEGPVRQVIYSLPANTTYPAGSLTQAQLAYLMTQYQPIINNDPRVAGSKVNFVGGTVTSTTGQKRKRQINVIRQFLTVIYRILFPPGTTVDRQNQITIIIIEILSVPVSNFDFLLNSASSSQGMTTTTAVANSTSSSQGMSTTAAVANPASSSQGTATIAGVVNPATSGQGIVTTTAATNSTTSSVAEESVTGYTPEQAACPNGPFITGATSLYPAEASWIQQRAPIAEASLRTWLTGIGLNANDYNASTVLPCVALASSGGGYRALLGGAGVIQAFDGREETTRTPFSGLLQGITYQTGASGGGWLVTSFTVNNYPTISSLRDSLWIQRFQYFLISINPAQPDYQAVAIAQIIGKKDAGFRVTAADVWSRLLAFQLIDSPNGGPNVTFNEITLTDAFRSFSLPFPIVTTIQFDAGMCLPALNASQYEFTPYAFGSWDVGIRAFTPVEFLGTRYSNNAAPANGQCVIGYDNAGFVLGTSSFLFNEIECQVLSDGSIGIDPDSQNTTSGIITTINDIIERLINKQETVTTDDVLSAVYPNPFQGYAQSPKVSSFSELNFVDGGETNQNIPLWPLIQPVRNVNLIFANDNSADTTTNFPNGTELRTTYNQAMLVGLPFPFIPDVNTFVDQGLNIRPTFFGCNETNVPLIIYLPNTNISFPSGIATFTPTYSENVTRGLIQNGLNVATRSNSTQWARCVACAIARRIGGLYSTTTSAECTSCFDTYCFKSS